MARIDLDTRVRQRAFDFLAEVKLRLGGDDVFPYAHLSEGFEFEGQRVKLLGPKGIFKPAILPDMPLSIATAPSKPGKERPYHDGFVGGLLHYRYRGTDPRHPDNAGLRLAAHRKVPLIYLHGIVPGKYFAIWPVFVVGDDLQRLTFHVAMDEAEYLSPDLTLIADADAGARRAYVTAVTRKRLHQRSFRERVLRAYRTQCALCRLRHEELLDAAHILPDADPRGEPVVWNGLALCKLHHAAFDRNILGVRPDHVAEIRHDILDEIDGPMLIHGLQGFHGKRIHVPRLAVMRPNEQFLAERYQRFLDAG